MRNNIFLSKPAQLDAKLQEWTERYAGKLAVDWEASFSGHKVYAITVTDFSVPEEGKAKLYVSQPHAHEPAATAAMIDVIEQLLSGRDLAGNAASFDVEKVLAGSLLTFNPIGNPGGVERSPYPYWDGSNVTNEQFWLIIFGEDPDAPGRMWNRVDKFDVREVRAPEPVGIAYEQIDPFTYVEPNRTPLSSYSKLFRRMHNKHGYTHWLDLHQTEFAGSPTQCQILLPNPSLQPDAIIAEQKAWAETISDAWREAGFVAAPPAPSGYTGAQAEYFRRTWGDVYQTMRKLVAEVKNNAADMPPERQMTAERTAVVASLKMLSGG
jgi:hypothetical protein